jgi:hypothetical protein
MRRALALLLVVGVALLLSGSQGVYTVRLVTSDTHTLASGETLDGELIMTGGELLLEAGSLVTGSVYMLGGALQIDGEVLGDVSSIGGRLAIGPGARIGGDLSVAAQPGLSPEASIGGEVNVGAGAAMLDPGALDRGAENRLLWLVPEALLVAVLAFLAVRFLPRPVARVSRAATSYPLAAGAMGILVGIVAPALLVMMAFTIILIPLTVLGLLLLLLVVAYGWVALGLAAGRWITRRAKRSLPLPTTAFVGTLLFMLAVNAAAFLPLIGGLIGLLAATVGLGAVMLTRLGTSEFIPATYETEELE